MSSTSAERRKELKRMYLERKPEMGVYAFVCDASEERFFGIFRDFTADKNSQMAKLGGNMHPNRELQNLFNEYGKDAFSVEIVETLDYVEGQDDYTEELATLLELQLEQQPDAKGLQKKR